MAKHPKELYSEKVSTGQRVVGVWLDAATLETLKSAATLDRRPVRTFVAMILEDWAKMYAAKD